MDARDALNRLGNVFTKPLLVSPLHGLVDRNLMLVKFTGRKSGKPYATPVQYFREHDGEFIFFTRKSRQWWKNLQGQEFITHLAGHDYPSHADVVFNRNQVTDVMKRAYPKMSGERLQKLAASSVMVRIHTH